MKKHIVEFPPCTNEKVPQAGGPFYHKVEIQSRFNDFDMFGHMNNAIYLELFDMAKVRYFESVMQEPVDTEGISAVVVNINVSFFSPSKMNEELVVVTRCMKISTRSFILEQRIVNPSTGDVKCVATTVMAGFDPKTGTGEEISTKWADALRSWES